MLIMTLCLNTVYPFFGKVVIMNDTNRDCSYAYAYNKSMGGADRSEQNLSLYRTSVRGKKWYFPLVIRCMDMTLNNAW